MRKESDESEAMIATVDERHCFLVVEESMRTETIAAYKRLRSQRRRLRTWSAWGTFGRRGRRSR
jgi:hypothetical protein